MKVFIYSQKLKTKDEQIVLDFFHTLDKIKITYSIFEDFIPMLSPISKELGELKSISSYQDIINYNPDLVITLGGDGTILNAITIVRDLGIPILGINMGRLGFLANVEKHKIEHSILQMSKGNYSIQSRALIKLESNIPIFGETAFALNDFTLHKRDTSSMVTIHTYVDDEFLNSYWADGLIVSTPTGSTGYSLSCGGPIVFPGSGNFVITPVAPHNLNVRPLILPDSHKISMVIEGRSDNFLCTLDSRFATITDKHKIVLSRNPFDINLAIVDDIDFKATIRQKLMWGVDKRN